MDARLRCGGPEYENPLYFPALDHLLGGKSTGTERAGVYTVRDAADYYAARHAKHLMSLSQGTTEPAARDNYIEADALTDANIDALDELDVVHLPTVSLVDAQTRGNTFGVATLAQLAQFPPYEDP